MIDHLCPTAQRWRSCRPCAVVLHHFCVKQPAVGKSVTARNVIFNISAVRLYPVLPGLVRTKCYFETTPAGCSAIPPSIGDKSTVWRAGFRAPFCVLRYSALHVIVVFSAKRHVEESIRKAFYHPLSIGDTSTVRRAGFRALGTVPLMSLSFPSVAVLAELLMTAWWALIIRRSSGIDVEADPELCR